ncbi:MAG: phosphate ABC transporter permease PstA [Eubacteriales bacterium]|nr:phosphate ABC transporter permease PstA [Eubacteriales bacterium]
MSQSVDAGADRRQIDISVPTRGRAPWGSRALKWLCWLAGAITMGVLLLIVSYILANGIPEFFFRDEEGVLRFKDQLFAVRYSSKNLSMFPAIINTLSMTGLSLLFSVPLGVGGGIYLAEYAKPNSKLVKVIRVTAETLAGIPSIIYALFGMLVFVVTLGLGISMVAGALTLGTMTLPMILRQTEESLLGVPMSYREGSYGLGAGKLRTTIRIVLPVAMPGILAAVLLSIGRISGETAALIFTSGTGTRIAGLNDSGRTLAVHLFKLQEEGRAVGASFAVAVVLLIIVVLMNALSAYVAKKLTTKG